MLKKCLMIGVVISFLNSQFLPSISFASGLAYEYLMQMGTQYLMKSEYEKALYYFKRAHILEPSREEPLHNIRIIEEKMKKVSPLKLFPKRITPQEKEKLKKMLKSAQQEKKRQQSIKKTLDKIEKEFEKQKKKNIEIYKKTLPPKTSTKAEKQTKEKVSSVSTDKKSSTDIFVIKTQKAKLVLRDYFFTQKVIPVKLKIKSVLFVEGKNIYRYLQIWPHSIEIKRIDKDTLQIFAKNRGKNLIHIWEKRGRITLKTDVELPSRFEEKKEVRVVQAQGFRFSTDVDWSTYYRGRRMYDLEKQSAVLTQTSSLEGQTPYGKLDANVSWYKSGEDISKVTYYTVGLSEGTIGGLKDLNIRGFYFSDSFSDYSFPGQTLRGVWWKTSCFNKLFEYTLLWGKETEAMYGYISPEVEVGGASYIEGLRIGLFPEKPHRVYFNYAHGYGKGRSEDLKDKVFSIEMENTWKLLNLKSELAFDEDSFAIDIDSKFNFERNLTINVNFRNIEKNFLTITGTPSRVGQIGLLTNMEWKPSPKFYIDSSLDIYRDRYLFNPEKRKRFNFDWDFDLFWNISRNSNWNTSIFYNNDIGVLSPYRYYSIQNRYTQRIPWGKIGSASWFISHTYQQNISPLSIGSDYRAHRIKTGLRIPILENLNYFINYEHILLDEKTADKSQPHVMNTGIEYHQIIGKKLNINMDLTFRNEENTESSHSFLAGEDSLEGNLRISFTPSKDWEIFGSVNVRNIWAENPQTEKHIDFNVRLGAKLTWDTPFRWNPVGIIEGIVFKDLNGDGKYDSEEPPLEGVEVIVGDQKIKTSKSGKFSTKIKGKKIIVTLNIQTLPQGFIPTTPISKEIEIIHHKKQIINFGAITQSGIRGIVFLDKNSNKRLDPQDIPLSGVKIILDNKKFSITDINGSYYFYNIPTGKHIIRIDVNSLPPQYLPSIPILKKIELYEGVVYNFNIPCKIQE